MACAVSSTPVNEYIDRGRASGEPAPATSDLRDRDRPDPADIFMFRSWPVVRFRSLLNEANFLLFRSLAAKLLNDKELLVPPESGAGHALLL